MKTVLLLLLAHSVAAGATLTWDRPDPVYGPVKEHRILLATNGQPWHATLHLSPVSRRWSSDLVAGEWRLGHQTIYTSGVTSRVWSVGFTQKAPAVAEPPRSMTFVHLIQQSPGAGMPWTDFAAVAMQVPVMPGSNQIFRTVGSIVTNATPAMPITP